MIFTVIIDSVRPLIMSTEKGEEGGGRRVEGEEQRGWLVCGVHLELKQRHMKFTGVARGGGGGDSSEEIHNLLMNSLR